MLPIYNKSIWYIFVIMLLYSKIFMSWHMWINENQLHEQYASIPFCYLTACLKDIHNYLFKDILINLTNFLSRHHHRRSCCELNSTHVLSIRTRHYLGQMSVCLTLDVNLGGRKSLLKTRRAKFMITFSPLRWCWRGTSLPVSSRSSPGHAMQSEWHDIKALPHQDWKAYILFLPSSSQLFDKYT